MRSIKENSIYRHFKGKYCYIEKVVFDSETQEECVVYRDLGENKTWVRKASMFLGEIDQNREDNITKQKYRFELVNIDKEKMK